MGTDPATLEGLRAKYVEILALRVEHAAGEEEQDVVAIRSRMAALATTYPGALREIDDLPMDEIRRRIEALEAVLRREGEPEPWMEAVRLFHALARGALVAKRWLGGRKTVNEAVASDFMVAISSLPFPEETRSWADHLARIGSPPAGRLMHVVFARLAEELGTSEREARRLVFGEPRREREKG